MSYTIRPSIEMQFTKAPLIAIAGPTGCGKTESAMRLARGYVGPQGKFIVIDTEEKRALYKRERHQPWDWMDFQPPFSPDNYIQALEAAKGYQAVVLDSGSHEWFGEGGCHEIQEADLEKLSKGDPAKMERLTAPAWKNAKRQHKKLMAYIIRYPVLLIVCLRAEPKVKFVKEKFTRADGSTGEKNSIVDAGYQPICEKMFMYEMLVGAMMYPDKAGIPEHVKQLEPDLRDVFPADKQITEETGARLAQWSRDRAGKITDHAAALRACTSTTEFAAAWNAIPKDQRASYRDIRTEVEARFTKPVPPPADPHADFKAGMDSAATER